MSKPSADRVDPGERRLVNTAGAQSQADTAALAYELSDFSEMRGRRAEEDWFEAERRLGVVETTRSAV